MIGVKRALLLSTGDRYFALVVNFATVAAISRILSPGEIGVSVVGMAIVGIAMSAREFASGGFLIQQGSLSREMVRGAFTMMLLLTVGVAAVLALAAPFLASAYGEDKLVPYLRLISVCLVIDLVPAQISTLLRRDMAFGRVAAINVTVTVTGAVSTVALALMGFSYMSFAWAWLLSVSVAASLSLAVCPYFWMFKPSFSHWLAMVSFGGYNGATVVLYKVYESLPYLLLGRFVSPDAAALLQRSNMICQLPDKVILGGATSVVLPAFATEVRQGRNLREPYLRAIEFVTALQWPALVTLALIAYPAVDLLLGNQWREVAPLVQIMAIATLFTFSFELNYPVLVSAGAIRDVFRRAVIVFPFSAAAVAGASLIGLEAVAWSLMVVIPFNAFVSLHIVRKRISVTWPDIASALWRSGLVALASALGPLTAAVAAGFSLDMSVGQAAMGCCLAALAWILGLWATRHPLFRELAKAVPVFRRAAVQQT